MEEISVMKEFVSVSNQEITLLHQDTYYEFLSSILSLHRNDIIPIVMGAAPEDYARAAPPHSYIHVEDFETPKLLAEYLHKLDQNDDLYNEYFAWKGTGRLINTYFWCRVCAMLHDDTRTPSSYNDIDKWWRGDGVCIGKDTWRSHPRKSNFIIENYLS
ncbi:hypothetical protein CHS0354_008225 [Potamilus streckersoni]|uniref:Fucosyltransferase n=1 Tax=Potamilus streckersoni TaxID=2493646 RepID=A0AAE0RWJ2_9BIVA|nr:hypothetical protein CHS0354_008225 [Potamilus streckersoni]